ncbi:RteC domain-containing protein [Oceanihabitans sediminis]|uniref:RteC domain-containing protein n=1 Tax=Oceanihabitans sediminis TaxID=1812012 RepID=UPI003A94B523
MKVFYKGIMQEIGPILDSYTKQVAAIKKSNLHDIKILNEGLHLSIDTLNQFRKLLRTKKYFSTIDKEILFFKVVKPYINGRIKFFSKVRRFLFERPNADIAQQIIYVSLLIDKLEKHKLRNLEFYQYMKQSNTLLDHIYFVRGVDRLDFPVDTSHYYTDPEFSTSHDNLAAQVISYELLTNYYQRELLYLRKLNESIALEEPKSYTFNKISWTASKTDLVELLYALHSAGAIKNGQVEISKMAEACNNLFDINLNNFYKTYSEIKNREKDTTKFLDYLKQCLLNRIDHDDAQ